MGRIVFSLLLFVRFSLGIPALATAQETAPEVSVPIDVSASLTRFFATTCSTQPWGRALPER